MERAEVLNLMSKLEKLLGEFAKENNIEFRHEGVKYTSTQFHSKFIFSALDENKERVVDEFENNRANVTASLECLKFVGNIIGSRWIVNDLCYKVTGYKPRKKRHFLVQTLDGKEYCSFASFLCQGYQLVLPTKAEFKKWLSIDDIENDAISRKDEDIYNKVNDYVSNMDDAGDDVERLFDVIDSRTKMLLKSAKYLDAVYETLKDHNVSRTLLALANNK